MNSRPVIVVVAYNRPAALNRLLGSLAKAQYPDLPVKLIISIDKSETENVFDLAKDFSWKYGEKEVIPHQSHLGLKAHILYCAALTELYGSVIMLEDDLLVSPYFYDFASQAKAYYESDHSIAGISLYNYEVAESCFFPFKAVDDGSDVYFMQVASSWGQLWTNHHWQKFKIWLDEHPELPQNSALPDYIYEWGKNSWKKHFIQYLVETTRYFVFPRLSLSTNFEELGTNTSGKGLFQSCLQQSPCDYRFVSFEKSGAKYDAWFEIKPESLNRLTDSLSKFDYTVDLYGAKKLTSCQSQYILTSKKSTQPVLSFSADLFPLECNVVAGLAGDAISLYETSGKEFTAGKLPLINLLEVKNRKESPSVSVVIPCLDDLNDELSKTLASLNSQEYPYLDVILVTTGENCPKIKPLVLKYQLNIKLVVAHVNATFEQALQLGFQKSEADILSWINPGSILLKGALAGVALIFKSNAQVSWIRGIDEICNTNEQYSKIRTLKYRLVPGEAYKRLLKNELDFSIELHFFNRNCLVSLQLSQFDMPRLFVEMIKRFQLIVVVYTFGQKLKRIPDGRTGNEDFLAALKPYAFHTKWSSKCLDLIIRTPLFNDGSWQWYYPTLHNFPDVLRFDDKNRVFYPSKY